MHFDRCRVWKPLKMISCKQEVVSLQEIDMIDKS